MVQDLRLVGISENGEHVLLTDGEGGRYSLALNDDLKRVVRRDKSQAQAARTNPTAPLRPRDVQALIRAGVPLEEIAERAGWSVEKVLRYEGPIRAERDYIGELAQAVVLDSHDEVTLRERAAKRLADRGVEAERVAWDAWKSDENHWNVVVRFPAGGRQREAMWHFEPASRTLRAVDDESRWLGGDENSRAPKSVLEEATPKAVSSPVRDEPVFDVEAEGWENGPTHEDKQRGASEHRQELTDAMRERQAKRGRTKVSRNDPANIAGLAATPQAAKNAPQSDEKDLDLTGDMPPMGSHPRPEEFASTKLAAVVSEPASTSDPASKTEASEADSHKRRGQRRSHAANPAPTKQAPDASEQASENDDVVEELTGQVDTVTPGALTDEPASERDASHDGEVTPVDEQETSTEESPAVPSRASQSRKGGRPAVPSWDDIMFGGRSKR